MTNLDLKPSTRQNIDEILKVTVQTTRKILKCDRVIVYDARELPQAEVIAESVAPDYASILGETIADPFLAEEYLEVYCYGQAVTIDDINLVDLSDSELARLKQLEIKSVAIAPISSGNELLALLVAHQCSQSQPWHPQTSSVLREKANIASYVLNNAGANSEPETIVERENGSFATMDFDANGNGNGNGNGNRDILPTEPAIIQEDTAEAFSQICAKINNELGQENILNTAVTGLRSLLNCDRVVVYSLDENDYGVVIAESVGKEWIRALGNTIDDPCIAKRYLEEYRNGRIRVINDINGGKVSPCYREQLEELQVQANLVAPIVSENKLFGLAIAHQCDAPRNWQESEINWITKIAEQVGMALEYTKIFDDTESESESEPEAESQSESKPVLTAVDDKWNRHFTDAIQYIRQSIDRKDILKASVKEVRRILECDRVVVYSLDEDFRYGAVIAESVAVGWTRALNKEINDPCFEPTYREKYLNGRVRAWNNIYESGLTRCYIEQLEDLEVKANLVTPIINEGKLFGLLVAHQCSDFRNWQQPEIRWVAQIATQVGFALDNAKLLADAKQLQTQLENETKLTKYFTDAVRYIRESLQREDILEISVEEVRRVLNCDRVVVYSLNQNLRYGAVIAESVAPGWTRALNKEIDDPCFEVTYREQYRNGRVRSWSNIYEAGMSDCYIRQLEKLEVKANLVTPIVSEGELFGLLVAHQCSDFRNWQQPEIRWVTQIATQVGFALDNAKLLTEAQNLQQQVKDESKWTDYFTDAVQYIRQTLKPESILQASVKEVRRIIKCDRALVYSINSDNYGVIVAESVAPGWTRSRGKVIEDPCFEAKYLDKYRNGRVRVWNNIYEAGMSACHIQQLKDLEVKANLVAPIINEGELFGLLVVQQCSDFRNWQQPEIRWVTQIATQIGFALDNAKLLQQLQESDRKGDRLSHQQHQHTEALKHQIVEILAENSDGYQSLSQEAMRQSETTIKVLHQIQKVTDSFNGIEINVEQIEFLEQQNDSAVQDTKESLDNAVNTVANIQRTVQNVAVGFDNLSDSSGELAKTIDTIKDLSRQIVRQSMNITRAVNRSQIDANGQNSVMDLSDRIFSLMQELFEASAKVEPLFAQIQTEVKEKTSALDSGIQEIASGAIEVRAVRQKLNRVISLNGKMNTLIENISHSVENQTETSVFAKDSVQEVASIAERISEQSMTITQSFNHLIALVQKL